MWQNVCSHFRDLAIPLLWSNSVRTVFQLFCLRSCATESACNWGGSLFVTGFSGAQLECERNSISPGVRWGRLHQPITSVQRSEDPIGTFKIKSCRCGQLGSFWLSITVKSSYTATFKPQSGWPGQSQWNERKQSKNSRIESPGFCTNLRRVLWQNLQVFESSRLEIISLTWSLKLLI